MSSRKKLKLSNDKTVAQGISAGPSKEKTCPEFEYLPYPVLIKILSYLDFEDRCNAVYACHRWFEISKNSIVWTKVDLKVESPLHLLKTLLRLPAGVTYLCIYCHNFDRHSSLWLPDILTRLHEQCPGIKSLIIDKVFFSQRFCNTRLTTDHVLMHCFGNDKAGPSKPKKPNTNKPRCKDKCCSEQIRRAKYIPKYCPQELTTISLRYAHSYISHLSSYLSQFLPKIKVLDLTSCITMKTSSIPFFLNLKYLEELYLVECTVTNFALKSLLKNKKTLKVLDLEGTFETNNETYLILKAHGTSLEKLFLGNTYIDSWPINDKSFPNLKQVCFRHTYMDDENLSSFLSCLPNLKYIDVSFCTYVTTDFIKFRADGKEIVYAKEGGESSELCHHFMKEYM